MSIGVQCRCGATYRVRDSAAGKRFRCKACAGAIDVPVASRASGDDPELLDVDDIEVPLPAPRRSPAPKQRKRKRRSITARRTEPGGGSLWRPVFGVMAFALGILIILTCVVAAIATEHYRTARGALLGIFFIGVGITWMRGKTYGE